MSINHFNIRVYGILINEHNHLLVTDELIKGHRITKLPGGGLEYGEGTIDCIKREFIEETNNAVEVTEHFYTTDFFQKSAYHAAHQIISIYYIVKPLTTFEIATKEKVFDFGKETKYIQTFRWVSIKEVNEDTFTLPIDKVVGGLLKDKYK
jgi:8-oxo-dGTP diphosphatase